MGARQAGAPEGGGSQRAYPSPLHDQPFSPRNFNPNPRATMGALFSTSSRPLRTHSSPGSQRVHPRFHVAPATMIPVLGYLAHRRPPHDVSHKHKQ
jgi:hypothetical protein